ncbi:hypothetical protein R3P38DRAFT_3173296 [Favolaschia claudopus]|uniref:Uncharacterized protein n=1 Tax=Favolaschia claudopus TaxID=2862362 RepID=A0AAW0DEG1_9AGAR
MSSKKRNRKSKKTKSSCNDGSSSRPPQSPSSVSLSLPPAKRIRHEADLVTPLASQSQHVVGSGVSDINRAFLTVLQIYDLMESILEFNNFRDIWTLTQTSRALRYMARAVYRTRIDRQIGMFLHAPALNSLQLDDLMNRFWDLMTLSHSVVHGSLLLYVERCAQVGKGWLPPNLNIAVPCGALIPWIRFLYDLAGGKFLSYRQLEVNRFVGVHVACRWEIEIVPEKFIILTQSQGPNVVEAVIASPHTANMQLLTREVLVMFYPQKALDDSALDGWYPPTIQASRDLERRGIRKSIDNSSWLSPCRWSCPVLWRHVSQEKGVLIFCLEDDSSELDPVIVACKLKWRLGDTCYNSECKNYATHYYPFAQTPPHYALKSIVPGE